MKVFRYKSDLIRKKQKELLKKVENLMGVAENDHTYYALVDHSSVGTTTDKRYCKTRWNSIVISLESVDMNKSVVHDLLIDLGLALKCLKRQETEAMKHLLNFLQYFRRMIDSLQGDSYPTISQVWPAVCGFKNHYQIEEGSTNDEEVFICFLLDFLAVVVSLI